VSDPRRLRHDNAVAAALLGAARSYRLPSRAHRRLRTMLGLPVALSVGALIPAAVASSSAGVKVIIIAVAATIAGGGGVVAYRSVANHRTVANANPDKLEARKASGHRRELAALSAARATTGLPPLQSPPVVMLLPVPAPAVVSRRPMPAKRLLAQGSVTRSRAHEAPPSERPLLSPPPTHAPDLLVPAKPVYPTAPPSATHEEPHRLPLAGEVALLEAAERAVRQGDFRQALTRLNEYQRLFPSGALTDDATVLQVTALVGVGERGAAARMGNAFLSRNGNSMFADRVRALLDQRHDTKPSK
jgi:TolA-binding protein